jgi:hypothetical protein
MEPGISIDDYIEQFERQHGRYALADARKWLGVRLYNEGPETFTRLRLVAGKSVRHILEELPGELRVSEEDIAQARFDAHNGILMELLAKTVAVDASRLVEAVKAEALQREAWQRDEGQHPLLNRP